MKLGGLQKTTLIDYPGKVACTVFTVGCNYKCPFCHNPELVLSNVELTPSDSLTEKEFFDFLKQRVNQLEAVVVCGGEPTIYSDLPDFCKRIKDLGFLVKLDTNGSNPDMIKHLIDEKLVDCIAMDVKAQKEKYSRLAGVQVDVEILGRCIAIIKNSDIDYEFRTTVVPTLLNKEDIVKIAEWISPAKRYYLQNFQANGKTVDPLFETVEPHSPEYLEEIKLAVADKFDVCEVR